MAKWCNDLFLDAAHDWIISNATTMLLCSGQPTDRADALTKALADVAVAGGDFSKADGISSGRRLAVGAKADVLVDTSGTANHVALISGTILLYVTTCVSTDVVATSLVDFPAWNIEIADPS